MLSKAISNNRFSNLKLIGVSLLFLFLGYSLFHAFAFSSIYNSEHIYKTASKWIYSNIPKGSTILNVHWDDSLPLHLPGLSPNRFKYNVGDKWKLKLYEKDTDRKIKEIVEQLAGADYIVFPTQRLVGSIPRVSKEYPQTTRFFQLLYSEQLGYQLEKTFKVRPSFLGITFDDDLADESFSVYDHPKVTIFRNINHFNKEQLLNLIDSKEILQHPTFKEMMTANSEGSLIRKNVSQFGLVLIWLLVIELLSLLLAPFLLLYFKKLPDGGFAVSKALGVALFSSLTWIVCSFSILPFNQYTLWIVVLILFLLSYGFVSERKEQLKAILHEKKGVLFAELLFLFSFLIFLLIRSLKPEIFWGEKPMDFTFLNYLTRLETLPPNDPWAAGNLLHYYYFGSLMFASLCKLTAIPTWIGYNLAIATIGSFCIITLWSFFSGFVKSKYAALLFTIILYFSSNLELLSLWLFKNKPLSFDTFWAASRALKSPGINEYPLWTQLFADLHAHLIAAPFVLVLLVFALNREFIKKSFNFNFWFENIIVGLLFGILFLTNTWDLFSFGIFIVVYYIVKELIAIIQKNSSFVQALLSAGIIALVFISFISPFLYFSGQSVNANYGWARDREYNSLFQITSHFGHWFFLIIASWLALAFRGEIKLFDKRQLFSLLVLAIPISVSYYFHHLDQRVHLSFLISLCLLLLIGYSGLFVKQKKAGRIRVQQFSSIMLIMAVFSLMFTEYWFLNDRMNTIFKFYNVLWWMFGISALCLLYEAIGKIPPNNGIGHYFYKLFLLAPVALCVLVVVGGVLDIYIMTTFQRVKGPKFTLDGLQYLNKKNIDKFKLVYWINSHISGTPVILEAQGPAYRDFTQVSMNTGLPTVLGWEHHVYQRGTSRRDIKERKEYIREIYSSTDLEWVEKALKAYNVRYVYIGSVEMREYKEKGIRKFLRNQNMFKLLYRSGNEAIYQVLDRDNT